MCACATRDLGAHVVQVEVPREGLRAIEEERSVEARTIESPLSELSLRPSCRCGRWCS